MMIRSDSCDRTRLDMPGRCHNAATLYRAAMPSLSALGKGHMSDRHVDGQVGLLRLLLRCGSLKQLPSIGTLQWADHTLTGHDGAEGRSARASESQLVSLVA